jgi:hypothetical protein
VGFVMILDHISMSSITERSVGWIFAIAQFVVSTLTHVELYRSASRHCSVTGSVAIRVLQAQTARAPVVDFSLLQIGVIGEPTYFVTWLPEMKGTDGGLYLPSL